MSHRRILILEIAANGHHPSYVRWLLETHSFHSDEIILASCAEMFEHSEIVSTAAKFTPFKIELTPEIKARLNDLSALGRLRLSWSVGHLYRTVCARLAASQRIDFVIVPFLDDCLLGLALPNQGFNGIPWLAITMRTEFHYPRMGVIAPRQRFSGFRRWLLYKLLRQSSFQSLLSIDPTLREFADTQKPGFMRKIDYLPDPATLHGELPSKSQARAALNIPADAILVVAFGEISERKGVPLLLQAAADPACPSGIHVLLAGRCKERARLLQGPAFHVLSAKGRIHVLDGYVLGEAERNVLAAADCMWIGHVNFYGTSGVMVLAGRHGLPVLATEEGLIGYMANKYHIGAVIQPRKQASVVGALNRLAADPSGFSAAGSNSRSVFARHDPLEFQRLVTEKMAAVMQVQQST